MAAIGGFEPEYVEGEMGIPELQLRFLDCLKIMKRNQQMQALVFVGSIGSFLVKKEQKTLFEELQSEIEKIALLTEKEEPKKVDKKEKEKKLQQALILREDFLAKMKSGKLQRKEL